MRKYAVVDLETTGPKCQAGDKIIQIGISLIDEGEIINTVTMDVNPERTIPKQITELTGITNKQVKDAPLFEDVADLVVTMVEDRVIIAHNINFDYNFLSQQLVEIDMEPLSNLGIDTVELTRILYPTSKSYTLSDLSDYFNLGLEHAHNAGADALATARLFLNLQNKVNNLPYQTKKQLNELANFTIRDTKLVFQDALEVRSPKLQGIHAEYGLVVKDLSSQTESQELFAPYPASVDEKKASLNQVALDFLPKQADMMDTIYAYLNTEVEHQLLVEAPNGFGKSLAYLLPLILRRHRHQPALISTSNIALQDQLIKNTLPQIEAMIGEKIRVVTLKGRQHFVLIPNMAYLINHPYLIQNKQEALIIMSVLIWLLETESGDLNELNRGHRNKRVYEFLTNPYLTGQKGYRSPYKKTYLQALAQANLIVTNHAYLTYHLNEMKETGILQKTTPVVIDEPQSFIRTSRDFLKVTFSFNEVKDLLNQTLLQNENLLNQPHIQEAERIILYHQLRQVQANMEALLDYYGYLESMLAEHLNWSEEEKELQEILLDQTLFKLPIFDQSIEQINQETNQLVTSLSWLESNHQKFIQRRNKTIIRLEKLFSSLKHDLEIWQNLVKVEDNTYYVLDVFDQELKLSKRVLAVSDYLQENYATYFNHLIYIGANISLEEDSDLLVQKLGDRPLESKLYESSESSPALRFLVEEQGIDFAKDDWGSRVNQVADRIQELAVTGQEKILVYSFNKDFGADLNLILKKMRILSSYDILLDQGKIPVSDLVADFAEARKGILIGSQGLFEGVDYSQVSDLLLVITRLPFDSPEAVDLKALQNLSKLDRDGFFDRYLLPAMLVRLKQVVGRVKTAQSKQDIIVLDERFRTASYYDKIIDSFDMTLVVQFLEWRELIEDLGGELNREADF